jgi:sorbitol-specific phosphotransferase system component IIBC
MNANELADYITENSYIGTVTMEDVATMLRQQHAEIAQLKVAYEQEQYRSKQWQERFESGRLT